MSRLRRLLVLACVALLIAAGVNPAHPATSNADRASERTSSNLSMVAKHSPFSATSKKKQTKKKKSKKKKKNSKRKKRIAKSKITTPKPAPAIPAPARSKPAPATSTPPPVSGQAETTAGLLTLAPELEPQARQAIDKVFTSLATRTDSSDPYYWNGRELLTGQSSCFRCQAGPALVAAVKWRMDASADARTMAISTLNALIFDHQLADGSFGPAMGNEGGLGIQTSLFANQLAQAYLYLFPTLDQSTRLAWKTTIIRAAKWLQNNSFLSWYANGNLMIAQALTMLYATKLASNPAEKSYFGGLYRQAMVFATSPPQDRWQGFGFQWVTAPTDSSGTNSAGYFAESGGASPGLDLDYTAMQGSVLAQLVLADRTDANLQLLNGVTNLLMRSVDTKRWWLQTGGGTRHPQPDRWIGFDSSALVASAVLGDRRELSSSLVDFLNFLTREFSAAATYANPGMAYQFGTAFALSVALLSPGALVSDVASAYQS